MGQGKKITVSDSAAIDVVGVEDTHHDAIYDLHGQRLTDDVNALSPGIYIRLHDGVVSKILLNSSASRKKLSTFQVDK